MPRGGKRRREGSAAEHSCEATLRLAAVVRLCGQMAQAGQQHVLIARVLETADPEHTPPPDPSADPLTGAKWPGPPGTSPPGQA